MSAPVVVRGNVVRANSVDGIAVTSGADPVIEDNTIEANGTGLTVGAASEPVVEGNQFCGNTTDFTAEPPAPLPEGNTVCEAPASGAPSATP